MPHTSNRADILHDLDKASLALARITYDHMVQDDTTDSLSSFSSDSDSDDFMNIITITPPSPLSLFFSDNSGSDFDSSGNETNNTITHYTHLQYQIEALQDEVEKTCVLMHYNEPMPQASQLHLLVHFGEHRPHLFQQKLRVEPDIFDDILHLISDHPIFHNNSPNSQLPISIQLAIFSQLCRSLW
ncbi:hypothetical protein BDR07DRAFT_1491562 [Suillus spraguei]|nr:hypothetical protein BDR07DRAFT_1491562 [Suillus spraguei]